MISGNHIMHLITALLLLLLPQTTFACDPQAGSTFCADSVMAQPVTVLRQDAAPATSVDPGIYVEGAVPVGDEIQDEL